MSPHNDRSALKRGQPPSSPPSETKKRRSERVKELQAKGNTPATTKGTPDKAKAAVPNQMSAPSRPEVQRIPVSSLQDTQVATQPLSQSDFSLLQEDDPNVWGYLDPITASTGPSVKLDKSDACMPEKKGKSKSKKSTAKGFLIGRHPECDLSLDAAVISNRHCVIYKEVVNGIPKAILEDLSSNGTWVNGVIVGRNKRRELDSGDEVEFAGGLAYHFRYPPGMFASGFRDTFDVGPPLGSGHFATVYTAVEKKTGTQFAVKVFKKQRSAEATRTQGLQQEIAMLMSVSHPNVLCLKGTYEEDDGVYLVLELAPEGELFNYIIKYQKLREPETRKIFKQLLNGLKYLHDRNIVHRDIKPENILIIDKDLHVKLADFGLAKIIGEDSFTTSLCGTPSYVAPEILEPSGQRRYSRAVDIWSLGVVLYICLCGFPPFSDELFSEKNPFNLSQQIRMGRFEFPSPYWDTVGDAALDLIEKMLMVDPMKRIKVDAALDHPWIKDKSWIDPHDSCNSLADAIENLGFVRRTVVQTRTLLAEAPGLANPASQNPSKVKVVPNQQNGARGGNPKAGNVDKFSKKPDNLDPQTKAFVEMGGKGGDETLYDAGDTSYVEVKAPGFEDHEYGHSD